MVDEYSEEYWEEEYYDSLETSLGNSQSRHDEEVAGAMVCAYFMATTVILGALGTPALANLVVNQRGRYEIHRDVEGKDGPWKYSPEGWMKSQLASGVVNTLAGEGFTPSGVSTIFGKSMPLDLKYLNEGKNLLETTGQFGYHEGMLQGQLEIYQIEGAIPLEGAIAVEGVKGYILGIPWTTCEDNGNCVGASPVCDECQGLSGEVFEADGFEPYAHNWCRCNEPLADPVIMESW